MQVNKSASALQSVLSHVFVTGHPRSFDSETLRSYATSILSLASEALIQTTPESPLAEQTYADIYFAVLAAKDLVELSVLLPAKEDNHE